MHLFFILLFKFRFTSSGSDFLKNSIQMNFEDVYHFPRNGKKYYWESSIMKQWFEILEETI